MSGFLVPSTTVRDVENDGSRFWICDTDDQKPFGAETVGVVDEEQGGIVVYVHQINAVAVLDAFRATVGEV
jgi:hypothetical protein